MSEHEPSGRVAAFEAVVRLAIAEADDDGGYLWTGFDRSEVVSLIQQDVSTRTVDRALKDAAALGWVDDRRQGWDAGPRAEEYQPAENPNPVE